MAALASIAQSANTARSMSPSRPGGRRALAAAAARGAKAAPTAAPRARVAARRARAAQAACSRAQRTRRWAVRRGATRGARASRRSTAPTAPKESTALASDCRGVTCAREGATPRRSSAAAAVWRVRLGTTAAMPAFRSADRARAASGSPVPRRPSASTTRSATALSGAWPRARARPRRAVAPAPPVVSARYRRSMGAQAACTAPLGGFRRALARLRAGSVRRGIFRATTALGAPPARLGASLRGATAWK
jgi:hypothetical protein